MRSISRVLSLIYSLQELKLTEQQQVEIDRLADLCMSDIDNNSAFLKNLVQQLKVIEQFEPKFPEDVIRKVNRYIKRLTNKDQVRPVWICNHDAEDLQQPALMECQKRIKKAELYNKEQKLDNTLENVMFAVNNVPFGKLLTGDYETRILNADNFLCDSLRDEMKPGKSDSGSDFSVADFMLLGPRPEEEEAKPYSEYINKIAGARSALIKEMIAFVLNTQSGETSVGESRYAPSNLSGYINLIYDCDEKAFGLQVYIEISALSDNVFEDQILADEMSGNFRKSRGKIAVVAPVVSVYGEFRLNLNKPQPATVTPSYVSPEICRMVVSSYSRKFNYRFQNPAQTIASILYEANFLVNKLQQDDRLDGLDKFLNTMRQFLSEHYTDINAFKRDFLSLLITLYSDLKDVPQSFDVMYEVKIMMRMVKNMLFSDGVYYHTADECKDVLFQKLFISALLENFEANKADYTDRAIKEDYGRKGRAINSCYMQNKPEGQILQALDVLMEKVPKETGETEEKALYAQYIKSVGQGHEQSLLVLLNHLFPTGDADPDKQFFAMLDKQARFNWIYDSDLNALVLQLKFEVYKMMVPCSDTMVYLNDAGAWREGGIDKSIKTNLPLFTVYLELKLSCKAGLDEGLIICPQIHSLAVALNHSKLQCRLWPASAAKKAVGTRSGGLFKPKKAQDDTSAVISDGPSSSGGSSSESPPGSDSSSSPKDSCVLC